MKRAADRDARGKRLPGSMAEAKGTSKMKSHPNGGGVRPGDRGAPEPQITGPLVPPTSQQLQSAPLPIFLQWNEVAMEALRSGNGDTSARILAVVLPVLEARLHAFQCKPPGQADELVLNAWRLAHALTLNNDGCQLRRDGCVEAALGQFQRAKQLETLVLGKPSCSTMLNLSAVLLSGGATEEALAISKECVTAAQDSEPILFVTALHNLAVALGQQKTVRERKAALPTMLHALREAQSALGQEHPTTVMLKAKCGLTTGWISQDEVASGAQHMAAATHLVEADRSDAYVAPPHATAMHAAQSLPPMSISAKESARAALRTLNFGEPIPSRPPAPPQRSPPKAVKDSQTKLSSPSSLRAPSLRKKGQGDEQLPPHALTSAKMEIPAPHHGVSRSTEQQAFTQVTVAEEEAAAQYRGSVGGDGSLAQPLETDRRSSSAVASVEQLCLDSMYLSLTQRSMEDNPLEAVIQEPPLNVSGMLQTGATNYVGPAGSIRNLCNLGGATAKGGPLFLRFSVPPAPVATHGSSLPLRKVGAGHPSVSSMILANTANEHSSKTRRRLTMHSGDTTSDDEAENNEGPPPRYATAPVGAVGETLHEHFQGPPQRDESPATLPPPQQQRSVFGKMAALTSDRVARREAELREERRYRAEREAAKKEEEAKLVFERRLDALQQRTRNVAAKKLQKIWRNWWKTVGEPRRSLQLQRLEELQRRRMERLALTSGTAGKKSARFRGATVPPLPSQQHGHVGGFVVPAVVVRCARRWLKKTECVRCLARMYRSPVDARLHESDIRRHVCLMQARWRGALVRHGCLQWLDPPRPGRGGAKVGRPDALERRAEAERREYAALVVQMAYRRHRSRQIRRRLSIERCTPPAVQIQRWLRATWADHRRRAVDSPTIRLRNNAALSIQRMWRGFLGRVAFRMRELRLRMERVAVHALAIENDPSGRDDAVRAIEDRKSRVLPTSATAAAAAAAPKSEGVEALVLSAAEAQSLECRGITKTSVITSAYAAECLQRSEAVQKLRDEEHDRYHIGLFVETIAEKERRSWHESLRLRPTQVLRRRAEMDDRIEREQLAFAQRRAAIVIQRTYRAWQKMRHDPKRDSHLLYYSRAFYRQRELGISVERQQQRRELARAVELYGDSAEPMRTERLKAEQEIAAAAATCRPQPTVSREIGEEALAGAQQPRETRSAHDVRMDRKLRRQQEEEGQRRDETLLHFACPHDALHVREGPDQCVERVGKPYEVPYYIPYVNQDHLRTLGID